MAGVGLLATTRLRRADARTGWLIAVGGAFAVTALAFSQAVGIFHPYYVSLLAPFGAALVGAGAGQILKGDRAARVLGPLAIAGGAATEIVVLHHEPGQPTWLPAVLVVGALAAAIALAGRHGCARLRAIVLAGALRLLLLAPATWALQTLGHATSGTFPAGGPALAGMMGGGPGGHGGGPGGGPGGPGRGGRPPGGALDGGPSAGAPGLASGQPPAGAPPRSPGGPASGPQGTASGASAQGGAGAGSPFGDDAQSLTAALSYVRQHGGGTIAVSSQSGAAGQLITSGADVAAIGGFSGRESEVSVAWLAGAVDSGRIRWVVTGGGGGGRMRDARSGSTVAMAAVARACAPVSSVDGLYDCSQAAAALRAAA